MSMDKPISRASLYIGISGSVVTAAFLGAAALGIWTENLHFHPTPRINSLTLGLGIIPIPALAWIIYSWTRKPVDGILDVALRVVISGALVAGACYGALAALFLAYFVG